MIISTSTPLFRTESLCSHNRVNLRNGVKYPEIREPETHPGLCVFGYYDAWDKSEAPSSFPNLISLNGT